MITPETIVLASTSHYRRDLLARFGLPFRVVSPNCDEKPQPGEEPHAMASRLALAKANAVATTCPGTLVIGSDQVAEIAGRVFGKPGSAVAARAQLAASSGRTARFHTAVCVVDTRHGFATIRTEIDTTHVVFRVLEEDEIARYVDVETPFDCAGSFKAEGLGITLFERIESQDPSALIGLPLIALARLLRTAGIILP